MTREEEKNYLRQIRQDNALHLEVRLGQAECAKRIHFLLQLLDRASNAARHYHGEATRQNQSEKNYADNAAIMLGDQRFCDFLNIEARAGLIKADKTNCDMALKSYLGIASKKELNTDPAAADRWLALTRTFNTWLQERR